MADLFLTHEGDISVSASGGLQLVTGILESMQTVGISMKTILGSFNARVDIGNTLHELVGELMTPDTLSTAQDLIYQALSGHFTLMDKSIEVRCSPVNTTQAIFVIFIEGAVNNKLYTIPFDFQHGILEQRTDKYLSNSGLIDIVDAPAIGTNPMEDL